jgi:hypothetical protein
LSAWISVPDRSVPATVDCRWYTSPLFSSLSYGTLAIPLPAVADGVTVTLVPFCVATTANSLALLVEPSDSVVKPWVM